MNMFGGLIVAGFVLHFLGYCGWLPVIICAAIALFYGFCRVVGS